MYVQIRMQAFLAIFLVWGLSWYYMPFTEDVIYANSISTHYEQYIVIYFPFTQRVLYAN